MGDQIASPSRQKFAVKGITCASCVQRVERSILGIAGVDQAVVGLSGKTVDVTYNARLVSLDTLQTAVKYAGYEINELPAKEGAEEIPGSLPKKVPWGAVTAGLGAAAALAGLYIGIVGFVQDFEHALSLITSDWYFVVPIVLGFGTQVGLFAYARTVMHAASGARSTKLLSGAGTGTSTVAMVACCVHHLADVIPALGLSGVALLLTDYRGPLMALGIISNAAGIFWMVRLVRKSRRCMSVAGTQPSLASS